MHFTMLTMTLRFAEACCLDPTHTEGSIRLENGTVWKEGNGQNPGFWQGPTKAAVHENQQTIWATMTSKLFRRAPEHVRPVAAEEAKSTMLRPAW